MSAAERARRLHDAESAARDASRDVFDRLAALGEAMALGGGDGCLAELREPLRERSGQQPIAPEPMRDATFELLELLHAPDVVEGTPEPVSSDRALALLRVRSAYEHVRLALGALPFDEPWTSDCEDACLEFDEAIAPLLHRLVPWNVARGREASLLAPALRSRFLWWSAGAGIRPDALAALSEVAALCVRFPAAADELHALEVAERELHARSRRTSNVVTLGAWIRSRSRHAPTPGALRMAAAPAVVRDTLVRTSVCEVSWLPPSLLVVDVLEPLREGLVPTMSLPGGTVIPAGPVEGALDRYAFEVGSEVLEAMRVTLRIPVRDRTDEIALPDSGD